jgi:hypothetical protein
MGGGLDRTAAVLLDGVGASRWIKKHREHASRGCACLRILGGTIGQVALFVAVLGAAAAAAAPSITTSGNADVQARIDCPLQLELDVFGVGLNRSQIWGAFDEGLGLPPGAMMGCHGQNVPIGGGLQVCIGGPIVISFSPTPMHAGRSYSAVLHWSGGFDGVSGAVQATAHTNISISVSRPSVAFLRQQGDSPDDVQHHFTFNVGCPESFAIEAADISPPATPSAIASGASCTSSYPVSITTAPDGAFPPSSNGLPQAIPARDVSGAMVGAAELVSAEGDDRNGVRRMELRWTPARGHESSKPYRICFRASTAAALGADGSAVRCVSVKVQKCQYCVQEGETIKTVAAMFDTDWLHIYTANPTVIALTRCAHAIPKPRVHPGLEICADGLESLAGKQRQHFTLFVGIPALG